MEPGISAAEITSLFVQEFINAQDAIGLDPKFIATSLKRLCRAKKTDTFKGEITTKEPAFDDLGQAVFDKDGKIVLVDKTEDVVIYSKPLEDNTTRLKALTLALNIRGVQTTSPTTQVNIDRPGSVNLMGYVAKILNEAGEETLEP